MLADIAQKYYLDNYNCAESIVLAANEMYDLKLDANAFKLLSAFGGGMGCGKTCGALAGCMAVLGYMNVQDRAHTAEGFKALREGFCAIFNAAFDGCDCAQIKPCMCAEETRCLKTVRRAADLLEVQLQGV